MGKIKVETSITSIERLIQKTNRIMVRNEIEKHLLDSAVLYLKNSADILRLFKNLRGE